MPPAPCPSTEPALTLSAAELDALRAVLAPHRGGASRGAVGREAAADPLPALAARLERLEASVCVALAGDDWGADEAAFALALDPRERELLACAIDAWMVECNERRGEPGAADRARVRWRAGGIALRL